MATESPNDKANQNVEISLKDFILNIIMFCRYLLSKWLLILVLGLLGGVMGLAYSMLKKQIYTATTTFVLEDEKANGGGLGSLAGLASMAGVDLGGSGGGIFQGDNILELYRSRSMVQKTLLSWVDSTNKELLIDRFISINKMRKGWSSKPELLNLKFFPEHSQKNELGSLKTIRLRDSVLRKAVEDINKSYLYVSKPDKKTSIIRVDVSSKDEIFAKSFNDVLVKNVNEFYIETKTKKSKTNIAILQLKTDSVRSVMNGNIYTAVAVTDATPNLNPTRQVKRVAPAQKAQFSAETNKAILGELVKNLEMSKIALLKETPLIQVVDHPIYPLVTTRTGKGEGVIVGGFLMGFLTVLFLILKRLYTNILNG